MFASTLEYKHESCMTNDKFTFINIGDIELVSKIKKTCDGLQKNSDKEKVFFIPGGCDSDEGVQRKSTEFHQHFAFVLLFKRSKGS